MNRKFLLLVALTLVFALFLISCGKNKKDKTNSQTQSDSIIETVTDSEKMSTESDSSNVVNTDSENDTKAQSGNSTSVTSETTVSSSATNKNNQNNDSSSVTVSSDIPSDSSNSTSLETESSDKTNNSELLSFEEYEKLTPAEQQAYCESFETMLDFGKWYEAAKSEYEANKDTIEVSGNGTLNLEEYLD